MVSLMSAKLILSKFYDLPYLCRTPCLLFLTEGKFFSDQSDQGWGRSIFQTSTS
jgi:hypothetical protein